MEEEKRESINKDWRFEEAFLNSNYLKYYNAINENELTVAIIEKIFYKYAEKRIILNNNLKYESLKTLNEKSVYIYTMQEGSMYRKLNIALTNDSKKELKSMIPLIFGINKYLTNGIKNDRMYKVYRGGWLPKDYLKFFIKDSILRIPALWSCSKQKQVI